MYENHFGLNAHPFALTPDTDFAYHSRPHLAALNTLRVALEGGEGFVKITGEVGTGKTLLCRRLLHWLATRQERFAAAYLPNPRLSAKQLAHALAKELGLHVSHRADERQALAAIETTLIEHARFGRTVVLAIDEAQAMPMATLETLRLLSNMETGKQRLLQIVLFGQPELDSMLAQPLLRSLASRISFSAVLKPLDYNDFQHYLRHRLSVAGWRGGDVWTRAARWWLWWASAGVPRLANVIAHKSLMLAFGAGSRQVTWTQVRTAGNDTWALRKRRRPAEAGPAGDVLQA